MGLTRTWIVRERLMLSVKSYYDDVLIQVEIIKQALELQGYDESIEAAIIGECEDEGTLFYYRNNFTDPEGYKEYDETQIPQNLRQDFMSIYPEPQSNYTDE
ncbi:hypothetical protein K7432_008160 [Basidiobolus ranarum]|uniref:Phage protein n=1 Tax=Basidiobolus ranarum TaxID=34480 RepID=A0ABR2WS79_9FUNG